MFRAGDHVHHKPTGEDWVLAFGDLEDQTGQVSPCGWPETLAKAEDCYMLKAATDEEHDAMLRKWAEMKCREYDIRESICKHHLLHLSHTRSES